MPLSLSRPWRRTVLVTPVLCGAGWMGLDLGLLVLSIWKRWGRTRWARSAP